MLQQDHEQGMRRTMEAGERAIMSVAARLITPTAWARGSAAVIGR